MPDPEPPPGGAGTGSPVARLLTGFARFWWDFLVGETPELFVGVVLIVALVALLDASHVHDALAVIALPVLVSLLLAASVGRGRRRR